MALLIKGRHNDYKKGTFVLNMENVATIEYNNGDCQIGYDLSRNREQCSYGFKLVKVRTAEIAQTLYDDLCEWLATHTDGLYDLASKADALDEEHYAKESARWKAEEEARKKEAEVASCGELS